MSELNIRVTHRTEIDGRSVERTIDIETIPTIDRVGVAESLLPATATRPPYARASLPPEAAVQESAVAAGIRFTRVLADGLYLQADSTRTDHVAVIDHTSDLMWSVESLGDPSDESDGITQEHCIERCKNLRLLGHDDWRLPTRAELAGLVDDSRHEPAINVDLFPRVKPRWHWTSTPCAWSSASAWSVGFGLGLVYDGPRNGSGFALSVRRAGQ